MSNLLLKEEWPVESDQVVLGFIELTLENIQGHRLYSLPGQPTPPSDALVVKVSPSIQTYSYAQVHKAQNTFGHLIPQKSCSQAYWLFFLFGIIWNHDDSARINFSFVTGIHVECRQLTTRLCSPLFNQLFTHLCVSCHYMLTHLVTVTVYGTMEERLESNL